MKNNISIKYTFTALLVTITVLFSSCDLETSPSDAVVEQQVFDSAAGNEKVINGTFGYLMETFNTYANPGYGAFLRTNDAMGNDVVLNTKYGFSSHYAFNALYSKNGTNTLSWNLSYKVINNANNVIDKIDTATGNSIDKQRIKSQALALRGFMYLHLASSYSFAIDVDPNQKTAPIYLLPTTSSSKPNPLSSVSELYTQSIADLEQALDLMPDSYSDQAKHKITKQVILGLLSRVHLYARNWEKAAQYSQQLLQVNNYLMSEKQYQEGFNDVNNPEWIWGHAQTAEQNNASYNFNFLDVSSPQSYYFSFNADPHFKELFDQQDYRNKMIYWAPDPSKTMLVDGDIAYMRYAKFRFRAAQIADIVLMRVAEIYLIHAEAKARLHQPDALGYLNELKRARNATPVTFTSFDKLIEDILIERRKELFGEGFALIDIIRNQQTVQRKKIDEFKTIAYSYQYTDQNGDLQQKTVQLSPKGHHVLNFPDKSEFTKNSKYYLYQIPEVENIQNPNI